MQLDFPDF